MHRAAALFLLTLAAACTTTGPPPHVPVRKVPGTDGGWFMPADDEGEELTVLDATGKRVTLKWQKRLFVIEPFDDFNGVLARGEVILQGAYKKFHVNLTRAQWKDHETVVEITLEEIPEGFRATLKEGKSWVVDDPGPETR